MKEWLFISAPAANEKRSSDFLDELKVQFINFIVSEIGITPSIQFGLVLDAYDEQSNDIIYSDFLTPDNFGHPVDITWNFSNKNTDPSQFNAAKDTVRFQFSGIPIVEIKKYLRPNKDLPFKVSKYRFPFECRHFHGFKDIELLFTMDTTALSENIIQLESSIHTVINNWNNKHNDDLNNIINFTGKLTQTGRNTWNIFLDLGMSDRNIISLILEGLDQTDDCKIIEKLVLL